MASLIGKADSTLVTAAARAGLANVPGDYSKQFGIMADANKTLLEGVEAAWKTYEKGRKASKKELEDAMKDLRTYGVGIENNADSKKFQGEMDGQYNIYRENGGFKNDRQGFDEWKRQNNKIMSKYKNNQTSLIEAMEKFEDSNSWVAGLKTNENKFLISLTKYAKNIDDKSGVHNEKADNYMANNTGANTDKTPTDLWNHLGAEEGEMVKYLDPTTNEFTYITSVNGEIIAKKSSEISGMIDTKAIKTETTIQGRLNTIAQNATGTYTDNDSLMNQNWLERVIDEAVQKGESLQYLMSQKYGGMEESFADSLRNGRAAITPAIIQSLSDLGYTVEDQAKGKDGHGFLDKNDFLMGTNYNTIVDEILNNKDTYELRRDLFIDKLDNEVFRHEAEQVKRTKVDFYKNKIQKLDGSNWSSGSATKVYEDILAGREFTEKDPDTKEMNTYSYHDGHWYQNWKEGDTPETKESYIGSASDLGSIFTNDIRFRDIKTGATKQQSQTPEIETEIKVVDGVEIKVPKKDPKKKKEIEYNKPGTAPPSTERVIENSDLEGITKEEGVGGRTIYYNYEGNDIDAAKKALVKAKGTTGIDNAFIKYENNGKQISKREYEKLKDKSNVTFKVQIGMDAPADREGTSDPMKDFTLEGQKPVSKPTVPPTDLETKVTDVDQDYGPNNPDPMFGSTSTDGTQMMGSSGDWINVGSSAYYKDLGIKSKKGKDFVKGEGVMKKVNEIASNHGFNVRELLSVIQKESNFDPAAVNKKSGATGLIQFFADKGKDYKTIGGTQYKIADIKNMSIDEQLNLIDEYFKENHKQGQHPYITIAYPKAHDMNMDDIIATSDSTIAKQNPVWVNDDGNVTKRSIIAYADKA